MYVIRNVCGSPFAATGSAAFKSPARNLDLVGRERKVSRACLLLLILQDLQHLGPGSYDPQYEIERD